MTHDHAAGAARRGFLTSAAGTVGAAALAGWSLVGGAPSADAQSNPTRRQDDPAARRRPFRGVHQSGIVDAPQAHGAFVGLDLVDGVDREGVRRLLSVLTDDIDRLMSGQGSLTDQEPELAAVTAELTVTVGVGPGVVARVGATAPTWLAPLPGFSVDRLQDRWGATDLCLQVCSASPTTVSHAVRRLTTALEPLVRLRWVQRGFREPFEGPGRPMRNLFGQVDGNVQPDVAGHDAGLVWNAGEPAWLAGGSALVLRRIAMAMDTWDAVDRQSRENSIGRRLDTGAPVTAPPGAGADAPADLFAKDGLGFHVIDDAAHVRRAQAKEPHERFLRRPYSYDDESGTGLLFAAYMVDPVRQFVPVQQRLAELDLLNIWTTPVGSGVWAVLPGAGPGEMLGGALLA